MAERCRGRSHDHLAVDSALRPLLEKEVRWYQGYTGGPWRVDETCSRVTESGNGCFGWRFLLSEAATSNAASVIDEERDPVHRHPQLRLIISNLDSYYLGMKEFVNASTM